MPLPPPYYQDAAVTLYCGDAREIVPHLPRVWAVITDPPYGQTSLAWDRWIADWPQDLPTNSLWCFGSLRTFMAHTEDFRGWQLSQDLIWQKQNGSSFHADRFRRVHEQIAHFYRGPWKDLYHQPVYTLDAQPKVVRRKRRPPHMGHIDAGAYTSHDGGPRLQRSVLAVKNTHGYAVHPTQKPLGILRPLIEYAVPPGGVLLDPFAGSGSTLVAAAELGRVAIGIEIDPAYCVDAVKRLTRAA